MARRHFLRNMILNEDSEDDEYEEILLAHIEQSTKDERSHCQGSIKEEGNSSTMEPKKKLLAKASSRAEGASSNSVVDRFSSLPDELAQHILSFTGFKCLTRVGSMSKRCRQLYLSTPSLDLRLGNFSYMDKNLPRELSSLERYFDRRGNNKIQRLSIQLGVPKRLYRQLLRVVSWISIAARCNVEVLDLKFWVRGSDLTQLTTVELPSCIFVCGSLRSLSVNWYNTMLKSPSLAPCYLRYLKLECVTIDEAFCKWISCSCKFLRDLRFERVKLEKITIESGSLESFSLVESYDSSLSHLSISGEKLVSIHIMWGVYKNENTSLNISAPNLKLLTWIGNLLNDQSLGSLMCLEKAEIFLRYKEHNYDFDKVYKILCSIRKVKVLVLGEHTTEALFREDSMLAPFDDASYLGIHSGSLSDHLVPRMVSLLRGMPNLNILDVISYQGVQPFLGKPKSTGFNRKYWKSQDLGFIRQLKDVKIEFSAGFNGMELARYILEHAENLKNMVICYLPHQQYVVTKVNKSRLVSTSTIVLQETNAPEKERQSRFNKYYEYLVANLRQY